METACIRCGKYGYRAVGHLDGKADRQGLPATDTYPPGAVNMNPIAHQFHATNSAKNTRSNAVLNFNTAISSLNLLNNHTTLSTLLFNQCSTKSANPLVDVGAPYSAISAVELALLRYMVDQPENKTYGAMPNYVSHYRWWQYGSGEHASQRPRISGSAMLSCGSDGANLVSISHFVVEGSSQ